MRKNTLVLLLLIVISMPAAAREFQIILSGRDAGVMRTTYRETGSAELFFEFNDRGRGDRITSLLELNEQGLPTRVKSTGNDYMKAPVDEFFEVINGVAHWQNNSEQEQRTLQQPAFYLPLNGTPEMLGVLARALLHSETQRLPLLPAGEAWLETMTTAELPMGQESIPVTLYFVHGLGFAPQPIWLDETGATFAIASPWFSLLPQTADSREILPELLAAQQEMLNRRSHQLAQQLRQRPSSDVLIRHARLYDPQKLRVDEDMALLIRGNRIAAVGPDTALHQQVLDSTEPAQIIDAGGRFVMPGLWDSHQHFGDTTGLLDMASGVTSARDLANDSESMLARRQRFEQGKEIGPRVFLGGFMDGPGPLAGPTKVLVDNVDEATHWVDWYAQRGYRQIKVYSSLKPELVAPIARAAHARGLRLSGHVPAYMSAEAFIRAGADEIQHLNMLFLNFLTDIAPDTRDTTRFTAVAEHAHAIRPDQQRVQSLIRLMLDRRVTLDPTVTIFEGMFSGKPDAPPPGMQAYRDRVPPQVARTWLSGALPVPEGQEAHYRQALPAMLALLKAVHDAGVPIVAGTDALAGFSLYRELQLYVQAGLSPLEALRTATLTPAQVMGVDHQLGLLAPGHYADLLIIDGEPDQNIADLARVQLVFKNGVMYQTATLQRNLGIQPIVDELPATATATATATAK